MSKQNNIQGSVWAAPLDASHGYAYIQLINLYEFNPKYWGIIVKIFDFTSYELLNLKQIDFNNIDIISPPFLTFGTPSQKNDPKYKKLGFIDLNKTDYVIPDFKERVTPNKNPEESLYQIFHDMEPNGRLDNIATWDQSKHLSEWSHINFNLAIHRIRLEWLRKRNQNFLEYETKDVSSIDLQMQKLYVLCTVPYVEVPLSWRGKVQK